MVERTVSATILLKESLGVVQPGELSAREAAIDTSVGDLYFSSAGGNAIRVAKGSEVGAVAGLQTTAGDLTAAINELRSQIRQEIYYDGVAYPAREAGRRADYHGPVEPTGMEINDRWYQV